MEPIPFDRIKVEHIEPALKALLERARAGIGEIASCAGPRTFENTPGALDMVAEPLDTAVSIVRHLESVATSPELREAWTRMQPEVMAFYSTIPLNAELWRALKEYAATEEARGLTGVRARFLRKTLDNFRRHGADLDAEGKRKLEAIDVELATVTTRFAQNVVDATASFDYCIEDEKGLAGLPESAIQAARAAAEAKGRGGYLFTLQGPSYTALMTYLDDAAVRETMWRAYNRRAAGENAPLIRRILELRREKARLLGYRDFAGLALVERMAGTGGRAQQFERELTEKTAEAFARENQALEEFRGAPLAPWDIAYWAEKQRRAEYDFDEEALRPYFALERVLAGMFELAGRLYGVSVAQVEGVPVWHPDVKVYEVLDGDGTRLGTFYADWFPREAKRGGAWMDAFITGDGRGKPHVGLMCGNLTPPLAGKPALLTHREVETIFHEFGHLLHHLLSKVEIRSFSGTNVAWDFVELPSQIMENWCWEREALDLFARHWETGEVIPGELFLKMRKARTFRGANAQMRQLGFGTVDLALHIDYDPLTDPDPIQYANRILADFAAAPLPDDYAMLAGFTHLFADPVGYGAGYYSYKWAEVLDADAFTRFRSEGLFNRETGMAFRSSILEKGDSEDPAELFRRFRGRDPELAPLLERLGLAGAG
jgi:oligopeptidase A